MEQGVREERREGERERDDDDGEIYLFFRQHGGAKYEFVFMPWRMHEAAFNGERIERRVNKTVSRHRVYEELLSNPMFFQACRVIGVADQRSLKFQGI